MSIPNTQLFVVQVNLAGGLPGGPSQLPSTGPSGPIAGMSGLPAYVYDVTDLLGNVLGTNMTPLKGGRNANSAPGGGLGIGYYDESSSFQLFDANEGTHTPRAR
jgi:hypothetical protein